MSQDPLHPTGAGHTELSPDDTLGLIPTYISTRGELFDAEQRNVARAMLRSRPTLARLLDDKFLRELHRAMFGDVWRWAGRYRLRETNIGIDPGRISAAVRTLVDDVKAWIEHGAYEPDEMAVRFHHRLVAIHPFANGNGRHGRVAADYLVATLEQQPFTWGAGLDVTIDELRARYRRALEHADTGDIANLVAFART